jgi:hypothetical protein
VGLKLNGTHQHLAYADDVNLLRDNIDAIKKSTETLIDSSRKVGLEINAKKAKYVTISSTECRSKLGHKNSKLIILKCVTVQIFGDNSSNSKCHSRGNYEEIEFW